MAATMAKPLDTLPVREIRFFQSLVITPRVTCEVLRVAKDQNSLAEREIIGVEESARGISFLLSGVPIFVPWAQVALVTREREAATNLRGVE